MTIIVRNNRIVDSSIRTFEGRNRIRPASVSRCLAYFYFFFVLFLKHFTCFLFLFLFRAAVVVEKVIGSEHQTFTPPIFMWYTQSLLDKDKFRKEWNPEYNRVPERKFSFRPMDSQVSTLYIYTRREYTHIYIHTSIHTGAVGIDRCRRHNRLNWIFVFFPRTRSL